MVKIEPFEQHFDQYENWFVQNRHAYQAEIEAVRCHLPVERIGLEIGVGSGLFAGPLGIQYGIEPSEKMYTQAVKRGVKVVAGIAEMLPFEDNLYDYALMVTTICFLDNAQKSVNEAHRVIKSGAIKRFVVMAGCDGRQKSRNYFTEVAQALPKDAVILTAGCAKYRYNKLDLGDIGGIPRVLDAGQCNDSYSLAVIALKLKEVFELDDINDLPISFDIGWYEQKAVAVLLALLFLGVKGIRLGPTLPAFVSPTVLKVLVEKFDIKPIGEVQADVDAMMAAA